MRGPRPPSEEEEAALRLLARSTEVTRALSYSCWMRELRLAEAAGLRSKGAGEDSAGGDASMPGAEAISGGDGRRVVFVGGFGWVGHRRW